MGGGGALGSGSSGLGLGRVEEGYIILLCTLCGQTLNGLLPPNIERCAGPHYLASHDWIRGL